MAYTPDSCQNQFTGQQISRMRCYLTAMPHLSDSVIDFVAPPFGVRQPVSSAVQSYVGTFTLVIAAVSALLG